MNTPIIKTYRMSANKEFQGEPLNISGVRTIKLAYRPQNVKVWISTDNTGDNKMPLENRGDGWINLPEPLQNCYITTEGTAENDYIELVWTGSSTDLICFGNALTDLVNSVGDVEHINEIDSLNSLKGFDDNALSQLKAILEGIKPKADNKVIDLIMKIDCKHNDLANIGQRTIFISLFDLETVFNNLNIMRDIFRLRITGNIHILSDDYRRNYSDKAWYDVKFNVVLNYAKNTNNTDLFTPLADNSVWAINKYLKYNDQPPTSGVTKGVYLVNLSNTNIGTDTSSMTLISKYLSQEIYTGQPYSAEMKASKKFKFDEELPTYILDSNSATFANSVLGIIINENNILKNENMGFSITLRAEIFEPK